MLSSLRQRATLLAHTLTPDGGGGYSESWQTFGTAWVEIVPTGASDTFGPDMRESKARHRILLRRRDDVASGCRLMVDGRTFVIHAVLDRAPFNQLMTLLCEELP